MFRSLSVWVKSTNLREGADRLAGGVRVDGEHVGDAAVRSTLVATREVPGDGHATRHERVEDEGVAPA
jgi:hypothetical protein